MPTIPAGAENWVIVVFVIAYVIVEWRKSRGDRRRSADIAVVRENTAVVKDHVANDHGEKNLRTDLDQIRDIALAVQADVKNVWTDVRRIDNRTERIGDEVRINKDEQDKIRRDLLAEIRRNDRIIAKHHPEEAG